MDCRTECSSLNPGLGETVVGGFEWIHFWFGRVKGVKDKEGWGELHYG